MPKPNLAVFQKDQRLAFQNVPVMDNFVAVIEKYNPESGWLPVARETATRMRSFAAVDVPPNLGVPGILKGKEEQRDFGSPKKLSFANQGVAQGEEAHTNNDIGSSVAAGHSGPADPTNCLISGGAGEGAGLGHATGAHPGEDSDSEDLYGSSSSDEE